MGDTQLPSLPNSPSEFKPSDVVSELDHFLTFFSNRADSSGRADIATGACQYYLDLGFASGCDVDGKIIGGIHFSDWLAKWRFGTSRSEVRAVYANIADLGLQRNMHAVIGPQRTMAFYVCNHPNDEARFGPDPDLTRAISGQLLVACVAMEYSPTPGFNNDESFTKFLIFGPGGGLISRVNLDGRGEKFLPGACVTCHGAQGYVRYSDSGPGNPVLGAQFLPFDLENFRFSTRPGFRKGDQQEELRKLNQYVLRTKPNAAIRQLIKGWYPTWTSNFTGAFVPPDWVSNTQTKLYNAVVKPACRSCHIAMGDSQTDPSFGPTFATFSQFRAYAGLISSYVCGNPGIERTRYAMPNALLTFDRFWTNQGGIPGTDQSLTMRNFLRENGAGANTECDPPQTAVP